jgi:ribose-phosphate pyrophosphokinase
LGLLDRAQGTYPVAGVVEKVLDSITEPVVLVFPDAGAAKRYAKMFAGQEHLIGEKTREFATGKITGLSITKPEAWVCGEVKRAIIVDDLCSRGGTFLEAGQALRENLGFTQVELCVTHLEANVYNGKLLDDGSPIDHIYTTDAMVRGCVDDKKITTYELEKK